MNNVSPSVDIAVTGTMREIDESKAGAKIGWYWSHVHAYCEWYIVIISEWDERVGDLVYGTEMNSQTKLIGSLSSSGFPSRPVQLGGWGKSYRKI